MLFDPDKRNGLLYEKLRYNQRKGNNENKKRKNIQRQQKGTTAMMDLNNKDVNYDDEINELIEFLKSCKLPEHKNQLVEKLKSTTYIRKLDLEKGVKKVMESYMNLCLVETELVFQS